MEKNKPNFAFEKKLGIAEVAAYDTQFLLDAIRKLMGYMKQINKANKVECEFFRIDFRQPFLDETFEFPVGCFILDMKWGSKEELDEQKK